MKRLLIIALLLSANGYAADIKKWVDEKGQVHYGDSPPAQVRSEPIRVNRPPTNPGKPLPRFSSNQEQQATEPEAQEPAQQPDVPEDEARKLCEEARSDLVKLNRSDSIRVRSTDGSIRYLSGEEMEERRKLTEEDINIFCK